MLDLNMEKFALASKAPMEEAKANLIGAARIWFVCALPARPWQ